MGILGGILGAVGAERANRTNIKLAREDRAWKKMMSDTAVTRRMADLENAGINPILAGKYDASTPAGSLTQVGNAGLAGVEGLEKSSAAAVAREEKHVRRAMRDNVNADTEKKEAEADYTTENVGMMQDQRQLVRRQIITEIARSENLNSGARLAKFQGDIAQARIAGVKTEEEFYNWILKSDMSEITQALGKFGPLAAQFLRAYVAINKGKGN